ncbi:proteasome maturation factor UMP1 [Ascodesmis nigricans]|uniref:Proteasome maturation factor UMP1 n=1 Tax=Ascodesmis nigricans TaxID=341454 RepID=A0A4S2N556_9PEZI|nr:proteasome maturation factor UMP1 [Ascodesmis nigricans]
MSLRFIPGPGYATKVQGADIPAPSAKVVRDTLRSGAPPSSLSTALNSRHPLEARLKNWDATQHALKMEGLKRLYGMAEPIKREMEVKMCADYVPAQLGGPSNLHKDILEGKDTTIEWEDVFKGTDNVYELPDFHSELETRCRMKW